MSSPFVPPLYEPLSSPNFYTYDDVDNAHTLNVYNQFSPNLSDSLAHVTVSHSPIIDDLLHSDFYLHPALQPPTVESPFDLLSNHIMGDVDAYPAEADMNIDFGFPPADAASASAAIHPGELSASFCMVSC